MFTYYQEKGWAASGQAIFASRQKLAAKLLDKFAQFVLLLEQTFHFVT